MARNPCTKRLKWSIQPWLRFSAMKRKRSALRSRGECGVQPVTCCENLCGPSIAIGPNRISNERWHGDCLWPARQTLDRSDDSMAAHKEIQAYNAAQSAGDRRICDALAKAIDRHLKDAESKIWHRHPVWFLGGNPIVGFSKLKDCIRLLFWSGQSFEEDGLQKEGSFKAAEIRYTSVEQVNKKNLKRWLVKARKIQWDYKNLIRRKGRLLRLN